MSAHGSSLMENLQRSIVVPEAAMQMATLWRDNRRRLAGDHHHGRVTATGRPTHLKIELTNYCNLACPMCPHQQMEREVGYMKPELFRRVIDQCVPELEFVYLHHLGESLFHGRIGELIRYCKHNGVATGLSTNATYLDQRKAQLLLESGLDFLVISMDGASPDTYERVRVGGDFWTTVNNVRRFFALKQQVPNDMTVVVQMIVTAINRDEVEKFASQWDGQVMIKEARDWAGQVDLVQIGKRPGQRDTALPPAPPVSHTPCRMLWSELTVMWDGTVVPCANVYEKMNILGNLAEQTIDEVWNGEPMRHLRDAHLRDDVSGIPVCATCPRHPFEYTDFVAHDQLEQRLRNYVRTDLTPRPGLS